MKPYSLRSFVLPFDEKPYSLRSFVLPFDEKPYSLRSFILTYRMGTRLFHRGALAVAVGLALAGATPALAAEVSNAELLKRIERLEKKNQELEKALSGERVSEEEPELATRLKAVEFQTLSMQKQARTIEALEGVTAGVSFTTVAQHAGRSATVDGSSETQWNYRADVSVNLPAGEIGNAEGNIFAHFRMGQGDGLTRILSAFGGANATGFRVQGVRPDDDATVLLAQAWYQLDVPLPLGGFKPRSRETLSFDFGKMDPFLFFDQNSIADDETTRFLNTAFVHNPLLDAGGDVGVDTFGFTPGLRLAYQNQTRKPLTWGASLGVFGAGRGATFTDSFEKPFAIAQFETGQKFFGGLDGNYRLYLWRNGQATPYANEADTATEKHTGWGVAYGNLRTSSEFRNDAPTLDADADGTPDFGYAPSGAEQIAELYYRIRVNPKFEVSPDLQHVQRPAGNDAAKDFKLIGLRAQLTF